MLQAPVPMKWLAVLLGLFPLAQQAEVPLPSAPPNGVSEPASAAPPQPFEEWLKDDMDEARSRGFPDRIVDEDLPELIHPQDQAGDLALLFFRRSAKLLLFVLFDQAEDLGLQVD